MPPFQESPEGALSRIVKSTTLPRPSARRHSPDPAEALTAGLPTPDEAGGPTVRPWGRETTAQPGDRKVPKKGTLLLTGARAHGTSNDANHRQENAQRLLGERARRARCLRGVARGSQERRVVCTGRCQGKLRHGKHLERWPRRFQYLRQQIPIGGVDQLRILHHLCPVRGNHKEYDAIDAPKRSNGRGEP